jgi:hypothetical protein
MTSCTCCIHAGTVPDIDLHIYKVFEEKLICSNYDPNIVLKTNAWLSHQKGHCANHRYLNLNKSIQGLVPQQSDEYTRLCVGFVRQERGEEGAILYEAKYGIFFRLFFV